MEPDDEIVEPDENPYTAPKVDDAIESGRTPIAAAFLAALAIPASFIAFCCTCSLTGSAGTAIGGFGSAFAGLFHIAGIVVGAIAARAVWTRMRQAPERAKQRSR